MDNDNAIYKQPVCVSGQGIVLGIIIILQLSFKIDFLVSTGYTFSTYVHIWSLVDNYVFSCVDLAGEECEQEQKVKSFFY